MEFKKVIIISTGSELTHGKTADTNSSFISHHLFNTNFNVIYHFVAGDNSEDLYNIIDYSINKADFIFITGGLGGTDDDITIEVLRKLKNFSTCVDKTSKTKMDAIFNKLDRQITELDLKMVSIPENAEVLENKIGLAPGFVLNINNKIVFAMPGVPKEMEPMLLDNVIPKLKNRYELSLKQSISFQVIGLKETEVNDRINSIDIIDDNLTWGITAKNGICTVTIVQKATLFNKEKIIEESEKKFSHNMVSFKYSSPEEELQNLLLKANKTLATAESCTGGLISKKITDISGSSGVFIGSIIAYSNEIKINQLEVSKGSIEKYGAVSEEVALEMARGIKSIMNVDIGISTTGIAGPMGGTVDKPVGTVCFGFALDDEIKTFTKTIPGNRERIRDFSSLIAIDYIRRYLLGLKNKSKVKTQ